MTREMEVRALAGAREALDVVEPALAAAGAEGELSYGILCRLVEEPDAYGTAVTLLVGVRAGRPVALVSMTGEHPALVVGFGAPDAVAFDALAEGMLTAGRRPASVNGARRWSEPFAAAWGDLAGARTEVLREMRAFELRAVRWPPRLPAGRFRLAGGQDGEPLARWLVAFGDDIGEPVSVADAARAVARTTALGDLGVWESGGRPTSMAVVNRRTPRSSSIGPVYTPPELRRRGFAGAVVAALSQRELDAGQAWCSLFTDLANPTSNHVYTALGYEPRAEFRHLGLCW